MDYNEFNLQDGLSDVRFLQNFLYELGKLDFPENPHTHEHSYLNNLDFKGRSRYEIECMIAFEKAKQRNEEMTKLLQEKQKQEARNKQILMTSICNLCEEYINWKWLQEQESNSENNCDTEQEEFEEQWEL